jgi:uncharacterized membrane protein YhaH (DUF805 family)
MISFVGAVKLGFQGYFDFRGKSTRAEFWWWVLFGFLAAVVFTIVDNTLGTTNREGGGTGLITGLWQLATLIPGLAVSVRRLHDIDKSGWWLLLLLLSGLIIPPIVLLIWFIRPSYDEATRYTESKIGEVPLQVLLEVGGGTIGLIVGFVLSKYLQLILLPSLSYLIFYPGMFTGMGFAVYLLIYLVIYGVCISSGAIIGIWAYRKTRN